MQSSCLSFILFMMVRTDIHERMQVRLCECGKVSRGVEQRRHLAKVLSQEGTEAGHATQLHVQACTHCLCLREGETPEVFYAQHKDCPPAAINNKGFPALVKDEYRRRQETTNALRSIGVEADKALPVADMDVDLDASDVKTVKRRRIISYSDSDSEVSSIHVPVKKVKQVKAKPLATSSTKDGIRRQSQKWDKDVEAAEVSQEHAHRKLLDKYNHIDSVLQRTVKERDTLEVTVRAQRKIVAEHEGHILKIRKLECDLKEQEKETKQLKLSQTELEVLLQRERQEREVERKELARVKARLAVMEKETDRMVHHIDYHIPLRNNEVCDTPTSTRTLEETMICYHDPDGGVTCLHCHVIVEGSLLDMSFRRGIQMKQAKK